jgi:hypothetical protein
MVARIIHKLQYYWCKLYNIVCEIKVSVLNLNYILCNVADLNRKMINFGLRFV